MSSCIAFDHQAFVMQSYGGISRYFTRLAQRLSHQQVNPRIICPWHRNYYLSQISEEIHAGKFFKDFPPKTASLINLYNSYRFGRFVVDRRPKIIHQTYYASNFWLPKDIPKIITVYDMNHELFPEMFLSSDTTSINKRVAVERADHIICISRSTQKDLIDTYGVAENKTTVVHLASDLRETALTTSEDFSGSEKQFLLFVGQRGGYKNFGNFISAIATSKNLMADFDIICFGGGKFSAAERELIARSGFDAGQVKQLGGDDAILNKLYVSARAFVFPSTYEGFGLPILEAMSQGCPVLCSNTSSLPEVGGVAAQYFDPNDLDDIAATVERCVYSDSTLRSASTAGVERSRDFSWERCAEETFGVYSNYL